MGTARLPTIHASVATRCQHWGGRVLKWTSLNKSHLCHQMSLVGVRVRRVPIQSYVQKRGWGVPCMVRSHVQRQGGPGSSPWMMRSNVSWIMVTWDTCLWTEWGTDTTEDITFPQLRSQDYYSQERNADLSEPVCLANLLQIRLSIKQHS